MKRKAFKASDLIRVSFDRVEPRFHFGDTIWLNSGSPAMTVVDFIGDRIVCAWPKGEGIFKRACLNAYPVVA